MQSEVRLVVVQLKREANLSVVIGFNTMHVFCRGISMLYPIFLQRVTILFYFFHKPIFANSLSEFIDYVTIKFRLSSTDHIDKCFQTNVT